MIRESDKGKSFSRRAFLIAGGQVFLTTVLVGRMGYLQVIEAEKYSMQADRNRISMRVITPVRGLIFDRKEKPLALNQQNFRVLLVSEQAKGKIKESLNQLGTLITIDESNHKKALKTAARQRSFIPVLVKENLDWDEVSKIQLHAPDLAGIIIDEGLTRHYPYKESFAHVLGYVAPVSEEEQKGNPLLEQPGARIGKSGLELTYEKDLRGIAGTKKVEINAHGREIRDLDKKDAVAGKFLHTSLDLDLQEFAFKRMGEEAGSAITMNIHTGEILAFISTPSFDPNAFNWGLSSEYWKSLNNPKTPLVNKPLTGLYSPGSTFKMIVALAALENGIITPDLKIRCNGFTKLGRRRFHCWKGRGHGSLDLVEAIKASCDIYFYEIAKRTGIEKIAEMARKFGLGSPSGIELSGEKSGLIPDTAWKQKTFHEPWQLGETYNTGIGQGYLLVTPLQLTVMAAALGNGGFLVTPHLTKLDKEHTIKKPIGVSKENLDIVTQGMFKVVNEKGGTALGSSVNYKGLKIAGKTGTTQVKRITMQEREDGLKDLEEIPWEWRDHALFVCYGPYDSPEYATAVVIEHGGGGSKVAGPIARDIMYKLFKMEYSNPNKGATP